MEKIRAFPLFIGTTSDGRGRKRSRQDISAVQLAARVTGAEPSPACSSLVPQFLNQSSMSTIIHCLSIDRPNREFWRAPLAW